MPPGACPVLAVTGIYDRARSKDGVTSCQWSDTCVTRPTVEARSLVALEVTEDVLCHLSGADDRRIEVAGSSMFVGRGTICGYLDLTRGPQWASMFWV